MLKSLCAYRKDHGTLVRGLSVRTYIPSFLPFSFLLFKLIILQIFYQFQFRIQFPLLPFHYFWVDQLIDYSLFSLYYYFLLIPFLFPCRNVKVMQMWWWIFQICILPYFEKSISPKHTSPLANLTEKRLNIKRLFMLNFMLLMMAFGYISPPAPIFLFHASLYVLSFSPLLPCKRLLPPSPLLIFIFMIMFCLSQTSA